MAEFRTRNRIDPHSSALVDARYGSVNYDDGKGHNGILFEFPNGTKMVYEASYSDWLDLVGAASRGQHYNRYYRGNGRGSVFYGDVLDEPSAVEEVSVNRYEAVLLDMQGRVTIDQLRIAQEIGEALVDFIERSGIQIDTVNTGIQLKSPSVFVGVQKKGS